METKKTKKILLAEDDAVNQFIIEKMFAEKEYDLYMVNDGSEACNEFKKNQYDLILMDINMPKVDGIKATKKIRKKEKKTGEHIPIIGITAYDGIENKEDYLAIGMDEFLPKQLLPQNLKESVNRFLV